MQIDPNLSNKYNWYIIQSFAGHENKVVNQIEQRAKANGIEDQFEEIVIPTQEKIVVSEGKKKKKQEKFLPGYILVKMKLTEQSLRIVLNTDSSKGFVGTGKQPTPIPQEQVDGILAYTEVEQPTYSASFSIEDAVKVIDGPFKDFVGNISDINEDKGQVKVMLSIFGRETPVELDFLQVKKL